MRGLKAQTKLMLNASIGGMINSKTHAEAKALIENITSNDYKMKNDRTQLQKNGVLEM